MNIVGIDISSKTAEYCVLCSTGILRSGTITLDIVGFEKLLSFPGINKDCLFYMESTGNYHSTLYNYLINHFYNAFVISPILIKRFIASQTLRKTKTDKLDALNIAKYGLNNHKEISSQKGVNILETQSKTIAKLRETNAANIAKYKTKLKQEIAVVFPEIAIFDIFSTTMLEILIKYPCAKDILSAHKSTLKKTVREAIQGRGRYNSNITVERLVEIAETSVGVSARARAVSDIAEEVLRLILKEKQLSKELIEIEQKIHAKEIEILTSVPGIGKITAIHFMVYVEDISRFSSYQKLMAYVGSDPGIYQSGNITKAGKITKHGNKSLRKYCYIMAQSCIRHNDMFHIYYQKKRDEGFPHRKAMIATMNKIIRVLYALLSQGKMFSY